MKTLEQFSVCAGCYHEKAELRFTRREIVKRKDGAILYLKRIPYYWCEKCGEETYDLQVEVFVERAMKAFEEGKVKPGAIDVGAEFVSSRSAVQ
ncbi:YgiT-type zinc finger protein [Desulfotomaculum copahuensis]|uniref:YgiT-type zinc finger domain-containing protein n=1 Tax=Desulfotomaculum copahuensis TaxID=1838280 RepID=A0A1B7LFW1_9FIRM|nr:YgiT-type zinc finger protein [Desulfotomaculum copahuensis]OAT83491.1 hypothetical protein A6M21_08125 [Desulfotomaculum copahuensis]